MYGKVNQSMAPNSVGERMDDMPYDAGDASKVMRNMEPNSRMNSYITNEYAGPGSQPHKSMKTVHREEKLMGSDYNV